MLSEAASLDGELLVPEVFAQDNLPENLTRAELHRSISHMGDLERLQCFLRKVRAALGACGRPRARPGPCRRRGYRRA